MPSVQTKWPAAPPSSDTSIADKRIHDIIVRAGRITVEPPMEDRVQSLDCYDVACRQVTQAHSRAASPTASFCHFESQPDRVLMFLVPGQCCRPPCRQSEVLPVLDLGPACPRRVSQPRTSPAGPQTGGLLRAQETP